jgi:hypothetical protein
LVIFGYSIVFFGIESSPNPISYLTDHEKTLSINDAQHGSWLLPELGSAIGGVAFQQGLSSQ